MPFLLIWHPAILDVFIQLVGCHKYIEMRKINIKVPQGIRYISEWNDLEKELQKSSTKAFILNKVVCDCGASTYFLNNNRPLILCSPRKELLFSKHGQMKGLYMFRPDGATNVVQLKANLDDYLKKSTGVPKFLVTYDSLKYIIEVLNQRQELGNYDILVDEFHCLYTDSSFKADVEIAFIELVKTLDNRIIFLSATPYIEKYLGFDPYFSNLDYFELEWNKSSFRKVNMIKRKMKSVPATARQIISDYRQNGCFEKKIVGGKLIESKEAVIYLNNVKQICEIIKKNRLKKSEYYVIASESSDKVLKANRIERSHIPADSTKNRPFTFVTKCSFEGADFYSNQAITVIFADPRIECLSLDISLDISQILGRQRWETNPFRNDCYLYYKTIPGFTSADETEFNLKISRKERKTEEILRDLNTATAALDLIAKGQQKSGFKEDYVSVIDTPKGKKAVKNDLVMLSEKRAWEIQSTQYQTVPDIFAEISGYKPLDSKVENFLEEFEKDSDSKNRLQKYCDFCDKNPSQKDELESLPQIDYWMKEAYNQYGSQQLSQWAYRRDRFPQPPSDDLRKEIEAAFVDKEYTGMQVRSILASIYKRLGVPKKAKATDLKDYGWCEKKRGGKRFWTK